MRFVDSNVLLYAISTEEDEQAKRTTAEQILGSRDIGLSAQVLQEFYVQATRASRPDAITHEEAAALVESFLRFPTQDVTTGIVVAAIATHRRFQISYWDAAIVEASRALGCDVVLSEDLADGQDFDGVRVDNPFD